MEQKVVRWMEKAFFLVLILLGISIFSICNGSAYISLKKIIFLICNNKTGAEHSILFDIRLPRIILGFAIGGALALSGVILQGMFRNPLVEPYTLGISGGAALSVCLGIVLKLHQAGGLLTLPLFGIVGSVVSMTIVYFLSVKKGILRIQELLLTGVMISFISSSLIMFIKAVSNSEALHGIVFWIMGSLEEPNFLLIKTAVLISVSGLCISYLFCVKLNALSLGEEEARHLGVDIEKAKTGLFFLASFITGFSVSITGIIGFIGLVVPHFMRMFVGNDHRILLISAFLGGAIFLIFCDTLARTVIVPLELPVGVITGILGGSLFIYILAKRRLRI